MASVLTRHVLSVHQRMEAPVLSATASASYREFQDIESKQLLFDIVSTRGSASQGMNPHGEFERTTFSTIVGFIRQRPIWTYPCTDAD
jgi:hypothetical protein